MTIHQVAQVGFGEGTNELYDRARPSYQTFALDYIRERSYQGKLLKVVEIGSGTGIFTRALLADPKWNAIIQDLKAVEPSQSMRDMLARTVKDDRIVVSEGTFDSTGVKDNWADLVVIAQAFHWCLDYNAAAAEFARILKPEGVVAFVWNLENRDRVKWVGQVRDVIEVHEQGTPQFRLMLWRQLFETPSYQMFFQPPEEKTWNYVLQATMDSVIDRASSKSYIAILPEDTRAQVRDNLRNIIDQGDKVWIDQRKGIFEYPYETLVVIARKLV